MQIPSVLFSFLEAALKSSPRATEAEIKLLMLIQLQTEPGKAWWWSNNG